jgi:hypothetical protein
MVATLSRSISPKGLVDAAISTGTGSFKIKLNEGTKPLRGVH